MSRTSWITAFVCAVLLSGPVAADEYQNLVNKLSEQIGTLDKATLVLEEDLIDLFSQRSFWISEVESKAEVAYLYDLLAGFSYYIDQLRDVVRQPRVDDDALIVAYDNILGCKAPVEEGCDLASNQLTPRAYRSQRASVIRYRDTLACIRDIGVTKDQLVELLRRPPPPPPPPPPPADPFSLEEVVVNFLRNDGNVERQGPHVESHFKVIDNTDTGCIHQVDLYIDNMFIVRWSDTPYGVAEIDFTDPILSVKRFNFDVRGNKAGHKAYIRVTRTNGRSYKLELCENPYYRP